ncbi:MAG: RNA polymerase sigma-70 factor [Anaerolineaceae bacterium]|nr:RNA polymerase sigma-70 factor [Anaerolineaceae bacterium]
MKETASAIENFASLRPYLFTVAYNMLGSVMDAEDMVQEAYVRWQRAGAVAESPKAYLTAVTTRLCIDHLRSAKVQREEYIGPWLPEPLVQGSYPPAEENVTLSETLSLALLVLLESLSPTERAVFLLREIFDYEYAEVAATVGKSEANCRQMVRRARQHLAAGKPRFDVPLPQQESLITQFSQAVLAGDLDGLIELLAEDIEVWSDGGGKVTAARKIIVGREKVAHFLLGVTRLAPENAETQVALINGQLGIVARVDGRPVLVMALEMGNGRIQAIRNILNPDKLHHVR